MTRFAFYDTETTGAEPRYDQVLQAAAILTDEDFQELESFDVRSRLAAHIVPSAGALRVTGVDPFEIARAPYSPYEFARFLNRTFEAWGQGGCGYIGFNTIRFDEELLRQLWWETLHDPYVTSRKGSSRNDLLIMLRAIFARNPEIVDIPVTEATGKRNFKLENVAPLNGFTGHDAHDALGDVRATIHMARLIRDTDPDLFAQMMAMGDARSATDFADSHVVFRMLGGAMLDPGILDVCLIASEAANPKNKTAWNLAVDPEPFLDLSPSEIVARMQKTGTPFRSLKTNKSPAIFPIGWEFLKHASGEAAPDPVTLDMRAEMIRNHTEFQRNVAEALRLRTEAYDAPAHLEEKIYDGFPSWEDKRRMTAWHNQASWEERVTMMREFEKPELRQLAVRTIYVNAPEALSPKVREACARVIAEQRYTLDLGKPWTTVGALMAEIDEMLAKNAEDPVALNIRAWALETYPQAAGWTGVPAAPEDADPDSGGTSATASDAQNAPATDVEDSPPDTTSGQVLNEEGASAAEGPVAAGRPTGTPIPVHFLDGIS